MARRLPIRGIIRCLFVLVTAFGVARADVIAATSAARLEAAFLRNFVHYLTWPANAFADDRTPWRICILGDDAFADIVDETLRDRREQGRSFQLVRAEASGGLRSCHVAYIAYRDAEVRRKLLAEVTGRPVLTVGDAPTFLEEGGMIRFHVADHVNFGVNLDQAERATLKVPAKVLEVAQEVSEHGSLRKRR